MKRPSLQFYPGDWRKDPAVQSLDYFDRGVWIELLCIMHESSERGVLLLNGTPMPVEALQNLLGLDNQTTTKTLATLQARGVAKVRQSDGAIYSKRMVEDEQLSEIRRNAGSKGGNPSLLKQNPSKPEANDNQISKQNPTPSSSSSSSIKAPPNPLTGESAAAAIIAEYHSALPRCERIAVLNPKRKRRIAEIDKLARQICEQQGWGYDRAEFWGAYFAECATDPWMRGDVPNPKNAAWKQTLDVLIREDRFAGIMDRAIGAMRQAV